MVEEAIRYSEKGKEKKLLYSTDDRTNCRENFSMKKRVPSLFVIVGPVLVGCAPSRLTTTTTITTTTIYYYYYSLLLPLLLLLLTPNTKHLYLHHRECTRIHTYTKGRTRTDTHTHTHTRTIDREKKGI